MKKMKNIFALALVLVLSVGLFAGCSSSDAEESADGLTTVVSGQLIMATNAAFMPYEGVDDDGNYVGIDVEIATTIAEKLGLELVIDNMDFTSVITAVQTGKADMTLAGLTVTEERKQNIDFSDSYATGIQSIIVKEGSDITTVDDLYADGAAQVIGTQEGTTGYLYCFDDFGEERVVAYVNGSTAVQALVSGSVDCVIIDNAPAVEYVAANPGLAILDTSYAVEDYAIGMSKDNPDLLAAVNGALQEMIADGTVASIVESYIGAE